MERIRSLSLLHHQRGDAANTPGGTGETEHRPTTWKAVLAAVLSRSEPAGKIAWLPQRVFSYTVTFAALLAVLFAASTLLGLLAGVVTNQLGALSATDVRNSASLALAALVIGLPIWLSLWTREQRHAARSEVDRQARERRLYLGAVFASTAIIAMIALQTVLQAALTLPGSESEHLSVIDSFNAGTQLVIFGGTWFFHARLGWRERSPRAADWSHDLALYVLAGVAVFFCWVGLFEFLRQILISLVGQDVYLAFNQEASRSDWTIWGETASWLIVGGAAWGAFLRYDLARGGRRTLRVLYLYAVLAFTTGMTLGYGASTLYDALRRGFGFHPAEGDWIFLPDPLSLCIASAVILAVHWRLLRYQATPAAAVAGSAGGISWPRRPAMATMVLVGLTMLTVGAIMMIWVGIDALCGNAVTQTGATWWWDRLSGGISVALIGSLAWLPAWLRLQRAAVAAPALEHPATERRLLLWSVVTVSTLATLGFTITLLWLLLRTLLGGPVDATTLANALQYLSGALILGTLLAYHATVLRQDRAFRPVRTKHIRIVTYLAPGAEGALDELRELSGQRFDVAGYLAACPTGAEMDLSALHKQLVALAAHGESEGALLILQACGGTLYPYTRSAVRQVHVSAA